MAYNEGGYQPRSFAPVKVGEELDVEIEAVGEKGDGIAKKDGFVLFVPNTKQGDKVKIRITRVLRKVGFAEVVPDAEKPREEAEAEGEEGAAEENSAQEEPQEASDDQAAEESGEQDSEDFGEEPAEQAEESQEAPEAEEEKKE